MSCFDCIPVSESFRESGNQGCDDLPQNFVMRWIMNLVLPFWAPFNLGGSPLRDRSDNLSRWIVANPPILLSRVAAALKLEPSAR